MAEPSSNKPKVLLLGTNSASAGTKAKLADLAIVHTLPSLGDAEAKEAIRNIVNSHGPYAAFTGLLMPGEAFPFGWNESLLAPLLPHCKLFVGPGAGVETIDVPYLTRNGAIVANTPTEVGRSTADGALVLLLAALKGLTPRDEACRAGKYNTVPIRSLDWRFCTIGILGLGNIGRQVAQMVSMLGMKVIYHNRSPDTTSSFKYVSLDELYRQADAVVICCPLTASTRGLINKDSFGKMKNGVMIVNVARGAIIVEQDLVDALQSGRVLRAALDVFENEPNIHSALLSNPNVTLSPHSICATDGIDQARHNEILENIIAYLETGTPNTPVNLEALRRAGLSDK